MTEEPPLTGDALTWSLHKDNKARWREVKNTQRIVLAVLFIMLTAQLTGFHVTADPTLHLAFP